MQINGKPLQSYADPANLPLSAICPTEETLWEHEHADPDTVLESTLWYVTQMPSFQPRVYQFATDDFDSRFPLRCDITAAELRAFLRIAPWRRCVGAGGAHSSCRPARQSSMVSGSNASNLLKVRPKPEVVGCSLRRYGPDQPTIQLLSAAQCGSNVRNRKT